MPRYIQLLLLSDAILLSEGYVYVHVRMFRAVPMSKIYVNYIHVCTYMSWITHRIAGNLIVRTHFSENNN